MFVSIDPGMNCGVAVWDSWKRGEPPHHAFLLKADARMSWESGSLLLAQDLCDALAEYELEEVNLEMPAYFQSLGGQTVAKTSLVKLSLLAGMLAKACHHHTERVLFVPINSWKGNLPKPVIHSRIRKILPDLREKDANVMDAIGIGLYVRGDLK